MTKIMKARQSTRAVLFPNARDVAAKRKQLPKFQPHDLRDLVREAGGSANNQSDPDWAFALAFRRRNDQQINELLRALGLDVAHPDVWRRAFFQLALLHHGVGHLVSKRQRPNRNSATWQIQQDLKLL